LRSRCWQSQGRAEALSCALGILGIAALAGALLFGPASQARALPQYGGPELVVGQAAGRVVFCVAKDAILIASLSSSAGSRQPAIAPLDAGRVAVVLGAVNFTREGANPVHLDAELRRLAAKVIAPAGRSDQAAQANDIESIGVTVLEFIRPFVNDIHRNLNLAPNEPLIELLLAGWVEDYGPEIWSLHYRVQQRNLGNDYWETRALRPAYYQLYPPEKGQPQTFVEAQHPPQTPALGLLRATQSDPALARIRSSSEQINEAVTAILNGESRKANAVPVADFMRAAIPALAGSQAQFALASIDQRFRFQWLLAPEDPPPAPAQTDAQPSGPARPSLRRSAPR
jgi:hypothetical protein